MEIRMATFSDWTMLFDFYSKIYREGHPLQNPEFWKWQFGNETFGNAIIAVERERIVGHLGLAFSDGYAWHINLFILESYRNTPVLMQLLKKAETFDKQGNLSANSDAVKLYRSLKWFQFANLERMIIVNPDFENQEMEQLTSEIAIQNPELKPNGHFWQQPQLESILFDDGSTAVMQEQVGGLRFVSIKDIKRTTLQAFEMGFKWCDFVTSFNNPILRKLELNNWKSEFEIPVPWLLNPMVKGSFSNLTFLTKEPIAINFYVNRTHADLGRIGSLISRT